MGGWPVAADHEHADISTKNRAVGDFRRVAFEVGAVQSRSRQKYEIVELAR